MLSHNPRWLPLLVYYGPEALIQLTQEGKVKEDTPQEALVALAWIRAKELARRDPDGIVKLLGE